ncbi:hypothetical protein MPRI_36220 [Mycobacterium paraintracellulare]|uniref:Uncharacterized protein n=1 Tax=Mycobacterium paraintracellulare TaxID=1138383 RepID=A0ABM7K989_9MYCO|nr:hypothetical protein MPRI_36220 [Mycobacterium paraintracellulare]
MIADLDPYDVRAHLDDFTGGFVAQRHATLHRWDPAHGYVNPVGPTHAAGTHSQQDVVRSGLRLRNIE